MEIEHPNKRVDCKLRIVAHDEITAPLPDYVAPVGSTWQARPTLPLVDAATPARPVLPFHAPVTPVLLDVAPVVPPHVAPVAAPRKRSGIYVVMAAGALALYSAVLVALMAPRRTMDAAVSATPAVSATMPSVDPTPSASASPPAPSVSASAAAPPAIPPRSAPLRTTRQPAPARTAQPKSDVVNPWIYD